MKITWPAILLFLSLIYGGSCDGLEGFLEAADLTQLVAESEASLQVRFEQLRVFPALSFGCHGNITGWRIAVQRISNGGGTPQVIIWRRSESNSNRYNRVAGEGLSRNNLTDLPMSSNGSAIYEGHPSSPIEFQPGDVLGILFVREPIASFVPYLRESDAGAPLSHYNRRAGSPAGDSFRTSPARTDRLVPLVALDICVSGSNPSEDYPVCGEDPEVTPSPTDNTNGLPSGPTSPSDRPRCDLTTSSSVPDPACGEPDDDASGPLSTKELVIAISVPLVAVVVVLTVALVLTLLCCTHYRKTGGKRIAYGGNHPPVALDMKLAIQPSSPSPYEISKPTSPVYETVLPWNGQLPSRDPPPPYSKDAERQHDTLQEASKL